MLATFGALHVRRSRPAPRCSRRRGRLGELGRGDELVELEQFDTAVGERLDRSGEEHGPFVPPVAEQLGVERHDARAAIGERVGAAAGPVGGVGARTAAPTSGSYAPPWFAQSACPW